MKRGHITRISKLSGTPYETVRRYYRGGNVGIITVEKIRKAEGSVESEGSEEADEKQTEPRKSAVAAKAGA